MGTMTMQPGPGSEPFPGSALIAATTILMLAVPGHAGVSAPLDVPAPAREMPELRPRFGVELGYYWQQQPYDPNSVDVDFGYGWTDATDAVRAVDNELEEYHVMFDWDVLPFLNLFALVGAVDGTTDVRTNLPPPLSKAQFDYDGWVYGVGATAGYETERWFATLTAFYSLTELDVNGIRGGDSEKDAFILMPRVGMIFGDWKVWVGAMYQSIDESYSGTLENLPVALDAELEQAEAWNYLVGAGYSFNEHWSLIAEAGFGDREQAAVGLRWRF